MADENVTIGIKTTSDNAGAKETVKSFVDISKETVAASKHATQLLYVISQLTKQLDGMDGDAAKALRQELASLSETINSLDIDRLKHLDSILAEIDKMGKALANEGFVDLEQRLEQVQEEAQKFVDTFANGNAVSVDVNVEGMDDLDALRAKIEGMNAANALVDSLKKIKKEATALGNDAIPNLQSKLDEMIASASNANPQSVEELRSAYAALAEEISKLAPEQKELLKSFNFDKISAKLDNLQSRVGTVAQRAKDGAGAINAASSLLQGNLTALGNMLQSLIERTKAWSFAMTAVGAAKATAAMGIFVAGMNSLVNLAKQYVQHWRGVTREMEKQRIMAVKQEAEQIQNNLEYADKVAERNERKREIDAGTYRLQQEGMRNAEIASINLKRQQDLAGNFNEVSREQINREADRQIADIELQKERDAIANAEEDRQAKLAMAQARQKRMQKAKNALNQKGIDITNISNEAVAAEPGWFKEWAMSVGDNVLGAGYQEEFEERIKNSSDVAQTISEMVKEIGQKMKDNEIEIEELEKQKEKNLQAKSALARKERATNAARNREDEQIAYGLENTQIARQREIAERERENAEADAQAELDHQATLQSMQEQRAALIERRARREAQLAQKEKELAKFKGVAEADLTERDRRQRQWLEQDVERLRGQVRNDTASIRSLDRQGDTERYSRQREYYTERRDEREADRQMLLNWQNSRLGLGGRTANAQKELELQKSRLEKEEARMQAFIASVVSRTGRAFRYEDMTDEEKARFGDIRSDIRLRKQGVRGAQGEYFNALYEGGQKDVEFRNSLKESNRLVAMGLAGGGEFQWGKDTAKNTAKIVELVKEVATTIKGGGTGDIGGISAQYGF